ncbi:hypothetical protein [Chondromyces apiculatus]|uniref:Lipoprotein n=1 Tax=Chondromyces apiculatus DSM 436 TaxID=1192034 RepID=A0A017SUN9_9BACT|nr:hypothetical protein [Chondromyces apiculatus]EYF00482.1 Hypothetical protein CAP_0572 [Chondromyces apiculatus DSM 436]
MHRRRIAPALLTLCSAAAAVLAPACGPPQEVEVPKRSTEVSCPAPIGKIPREDCGAIEKEFEPLAVREALKRTGTDATSVQRTEAIRAAAQLATQLKEQRAELCETYNRCEVTPEAHATKDRQLTEMMNALITLWDSRQLGGPEQVARFKGGVHALSSKLGGPGATAAEGSGADRKQAVTTVGGDKLQQIAAEGITFSKSGSDVTVQAQAGAPRLVLRSSTGLPLRAGKRYLVRVNGSYTPATPALVSPGDEVVGRLRFRTTLASEIYVALRSLEDPEAPESITTLQLGAKEKGSREARFVADPGASGFYLTVGSRGPAQVHLDDVELVRGDTVLAAARAETADEPLVKTGCKADTAQPLAGKRSLRCDGQGDLVSLGVPTAYLELAIRSPSGDRAALRTQSLEGGRSLDATLTEDAELVISIAGAGTATVRTVDIQAVAP